VDGVYVLNKLDKECMQSFRRETEREHLCEGGG
jgi:hypothetical protein